MISKDINLAIEILKQDGIIGLPTETVYGLAARMSSEMAIKKIFELKNRPLTNPLIVHLAKAEDLLLVAENIPPLALTLAEHFWPGPLTLILKKAKTISPLITATQTTVAVRMPNHGMALKLINQLGEPLVAPSANPYMAVSSTTADHVENYFGNKLPLVLDGGPCKKGIESTIIGFEENYLILYRHGSVTKEMIEAKTKCKVFYHERQHNKIQTPGMHFKHYAPKTPLIITDNIVDSYQTHKDKKVGLLTFLAPIIDKNHQYVLSADGNIEIAASNLYKLLIAIDKKGYDLIIAEKLPEKGLGISINDRLKRASY